MTLPDDLVEDVTEDLAEPRDWRDPCCEECGRPFGWSAIAEAAVTAVLRALRECEAVVTAAAKALQDDQSWLDKHGKEPHLVYLDTNPVEAGRIVVAAIAKLADDE